VTWIGLGVLPERWRLKIVLIGGGGRSSASESDAVRVEMDEVIEGCWDGVWWMMAYGKKARPMIA